MSLLTLISDVCREQNLAVPTTVIGNTNKIVVQLLTLLYRTGEDAISRYEWPELIKEHTFSTVDSTASYALPADFHRMISDTEWDRTNDWPLIGPLSVQEWQARKSGTVTTSSHAMFRIKGITDNEFFIHPTPDSADSLVFEYVSDIWFRPKTWTNGTVFAAGAYCFENGIIYSSAIGGTTSGTGVADDAGVTDWVANTSYSAFVADTDICVLSESFLGLGVQWRFLRAKGLPYQEFQNEWYSQLKREFLKKKGTKKLSIGRSAMSRFITSYNAPDIGLG